MLQAVLTEPGSFLRGASDIVESPGRAVVALPGLNIPIGDEESFPLLSSIDPHGYAFFNGGQMGRIVVELDRLESTLSLSDAQGRASIDTLREVARDGATRVHAILAVVGD